VSSIYNEFHNNAYVPYEWEVIKDRQRVEEVSTLDDLMVKLYGGHFCRMRDLEKIPVNPQVKKIINDSYRLDVQTPIYAVCYNKWFRLLVPLLPMKLESKIEEKIHLNDWESAKEKNLLATYFAGYDELDVFDEPIVTNVVVNYKKDYYNFLSRTYTNQQLVAFVRKKCDKFNLHEVELRLERALELIDTIQDKDKYFFKVYDDQYGSLTMAMKERGLLCMSSIDRNSDYGFFSDLWRDWDLSMNDWDSDGEDVVICNFTGVLEKREWYEACKRGIFLCPLSEVEGVMRYHFRNMKVQKNPRLVHIPLERFYFPEGVYKAQVVINKNYQYPHYITNVVELNMHNVGYHNLDRYEFELYVKRLDDELDWLDYDHHQQIERLHNTDKFRSVNLYVVSRGMEVEYRGNNIWYAEEDKYVYVLGMCYRSVRRIMDDRHWNGLDLFFIRIIQYGNLWYGVYRDRSKMTMHQIRMLVHRRRARIRWEMIELKAKPNRLKEKYF